MRRFYSQVLYGSALTMASAPGTAAAQTVSGLDGSSQDLLRYILSDPFLVAAIFLAVVLCLGKTLDQIRDRRARRPRLDVGLQDEAQQDI